jgi:uncharacterized protein YdbL (DUF1318 family)
MRYFSRIFAVMSEQEPPRNGGPAANPAEISGSANIRLSPFWANSPAAWLQTTKAHFTLRRVTDPIDKYLVVLTALGEAQADKVKSIVEAIPTAASYEALRSASHLSPADALPASGQDSEHALLGQHETD